MQRFFHSVPPFACVHSLLRRTHADGVDIVTLKDGSVLRSEVVDMADGKRRPKTTFGTDEIISIK